ncbi:MAG TPA: ribosome recycling factor [Alphaproteobacteria bacterium]|jgi:ribosome recycling factor|nr:ribosome recycling factor [Alphaproteobacteria bacterium]HAM48412.1 ribosome recycling factor [Alphaproteobacteria bacterium]HBA43249.1 ribosome recycling factor [Alphaproteobacteria bacterium]HBC54012.1 ribosome recycling factor [Alphaproteobacteria bacterium]HBF97092.1 ribosome recycling factor [Alphaproteobacteria bacterium]
MSDEEPDIDDIERRMAGAVSTLKSEFAGLRTGRASASLLDPVVVDAYGSQMPLTEVGTVSVPEPRMISVQVWDKGNVSAVEKAIIKSGLGLNPAVDGTLIRIPIPDLNEERRQELTRVASRYAEEARVAIRNVRRHGMDELKRLEKDGHLSKDDQKIWSDEIQSMTDDMVKQVDTLLAEKEKEIMQV